MVLLQQLPQQHLEQLIEQLLGRLLGRLLEQLLEQLLRKSELQSASTGFLTAGRGDASGGCMQMRTTTYPVTV